jgi:amino acid transporter
MHNGRSLHENATNSQEIFEKQTAEEVKNASVVTPKTMFWAYMLNIPLAFAMLLVFLFAMTDVETAVDQAFPFVWILSNSLSTAGAQAITAIMFILVFMIATSCFASTSRQLFAFARDDGMPFPTWMKKVNPQLNVAANSCLVTWGYTVVMSLIYIGSPIAFNAIISLAIVALMATYAISIACVLWRRIAHPETLPPVFWSLGKWGVVVNALGLVYAIYAFFWAFWPIYWKPTADEVSFTVFLSPLSLLSIFSPYLPEEHIVTVVLPSLFNLGLQHGSGTTVWRVQRNTTPYGPKANADVRFREHTDELGDRHLRGRHVHFRGQLLLVGAQDVQGPCGDL